MPQIHITNDGNRTLDADQRRIPPAVQEIVREIKLLHENIKMCESTIQLCNARLSTMTALCQVFIHQSPAAAPLSLQEEKHIDSERRDGETTEPEDSTQSQSANLAISGPVQLVSIEPICTGSPSVRSIGVATVDSTPITTIPAEPIPVEVIPRVRTLDRSLSPSSTGQTNIIVNKSQQKLTKQRSSAKRPGKDRQDPLGNKRLKVSGTEPTAPRKTSTVEWTIEDLSPVEHEASRQYIETVFAKAHQKVQPVEPDVSANRRPDSRSGSEALDEIPLDICNAAGSADTIDNVVTEEPRPDDVPNAIDVEDAVDPQRPAEGDDAKAIPPIRGPASPQQRDESAPMPGPSRMPARRSVRKRKPTPRLVDVLAQGKGGFPRTTTQKSTSRPPTPQSQRRIDPTPELPYTSDAWAEVAIQNILARVARGSPQHDSD